MSVVSGQFAVGGRSNDGRHKCRHYEDNIFKRGHIRCCSLEIIDLFVFWNEQLTTIMDTTESRDKYIRGSWCFQGEILRENHE